MAKKGPCRGSLLLLAALAGILAACVSAPRGGRLVPAASPENGRLVPAKSEGSGGSSGKLTAASSKGLKIVSDPADAEVYVNGNLVGRTPLDITTLDKGRYHVEIRKSGYEPAIAWIDYSGDSMLYQVTLKQITGFLSLSISPEGSIALIEGSTAEPGVIELPVGSYTLTARCFGYAGQSIQFLILPYATVSVSLTLEPVDFSITRLSIPRPTVNPDDPGMLGMLEASLEVTGPGKAAVSVFDASSVEVYGEDLSPFTTWKYDYTWDCVSSGGTPLPDGVYRLVLTGVGSDGVHSSREQTFHIDRTVRKTVRSSWSGSSGLMYAPSAEVLPDGGMQFGAMGVAGIVGTAEFSAPVQLYLRMGVGGSLEMDLQCGFIAGDTVPFTAGVSVRYPLARAAGGQGFSAAVEAKLSAQVNPLYGVFASDILSNFTGLSIGLPLQLNLGPAGILADAGIIASLWSPYDPLIPPAFAFTAWGYVRAGLLLDLKTVSGGISFCARTGGFLSDPLSLPAPYHAAAEIHWLIPGTHAVISGAAIGEIHDEIDFYAGLGFGLIY